MATHRAGVLTASHGLAGTTMTGINRTQSISISPQISRIDTFVTDRFKPLNSRPINNYIPVQFSLDHVKNDSSLEVNFGLTNVSGCLVNLINSQRISGYGLRNFEVYFGDSLNSVYQGKYDLPSGALNSYSLSASVGDIVKTSYAFECVNYGVSNTSTPKSGTNYDNGVVINDGISLSTINLSGIGISGINIQNVTLSINIERSAVMELGSRFPVSRQITNAEASLQFNGFIEGFTNSASNILDSIKCGNFLTGTIVLSLTPACSGSATSTYTIVNPYIASFNTQAVADSFLSLEGSFSIPLSPIAAESGISSNLIIS